MFRKITTQSLVTAGMIAATSSHAMACATCGCSLSTDAAAGYTTTPGWRATLQFDYINQDELRSGSSSIAAPQIASINDAGGNQEVEHGTSNRYTTFALSYAPSADWNFKFFLPYIDRSHSTYGATNNPLTPDQISSASISGLGDIKFIANYQGLLPEKNLGFQLGVKLPTGNYGGPNAAGTGIAGKSPVAFSSGPAAQIVSPGNLVDTSLQAGTGSTDLIVGAYYHQPVSENYRAFVNFQYQAAISEKLDQQDQDYRPGDSGTLSFGLRYEANPDLVPQVQVNISRKSHDMGALADVTDTAGTVAYLSPGMTAVITKNVQAYGFVQLPVYSKLDGYQLFPRWTLSAGISLSF